VSAIFGWLGALDAVWLRPMHERLRHRGAGLHAIELDGCGWMAVADLQPIRCAADDGALHAIVDGALYTTGTDRVGPESAPAAQWVLESYRRRQATLIDELNGEFALALWDGRRRALVLARDLAGARPIYWTVLASGTVAFASEYKALLALPGFDFAVDREMLQQLQYMKHLPSTRTLFRAVHSVPPGAAVTLTPEGDIREVARAPVPPLSVSREPQAELEQRIIDSFCEAVSARARAVPRIGVALSGGIDSIGVAFACRKAIPDAPLHTFTAGSGPDDPEVQTAALVSGRLGAHHHIVTVPASAVVERLPQAIWHVEAPIARSETVQFLEIGRAAQGVVDAMLTGAAADALYAGMPNHKILRLYERVPPLRRGLHEFHSMTQTGYLPSSLTGRLMRAAYFKGALPDAPRIAGAAHEPALRELPPLGPEFVNEYLHSDYPEHVARWLPKVERTLAAFGVGFMSPFLDNRCAQVAFTVPARLKINGWKEKYILRRALRTLVGEELTRFPKFPMRMKYDRTFADHLDELVGQYLSPRRVRARGLFDPATLEPVRHYRRGGRYTAEGAMRAWTCVGTEIWAEQFLDRRGEPLE